jgi:hypothetical protein
VRRRICSAALRDHQKEKIALTSIPASLSSLIVRLEDWQLARHQTMTTASQQTHHGFHGKDEPAERRVLSSCMFVVFGRAVQNKIRAFVIPLISESSFMNTRFVYYIQILDGAINEENRLARLYFVPRGRLQPPCCAEIAHYLSFISFDQNTRWRRIFKVIFRSWTQFRKTGDHLSINGPSQYFRGSVSVNRKINRLGVFNFYQHPCPLGIADGISAGLSCISSFARKFVLINKSAKQATLIATPRIVAPQYRR